MCTVTFVPVSDGFVITSNRDEKITRDRALPPQKHSFQETEITFPKDQKAGGTWIAFTKNKVIVLLNGGQEKHVARPSYRKSRGIIALEIIASSNSLSYWNNLDLIDIEPFTIVFFEENQLYQLQWNEHEKSCQKLSNTQSHIWSSVTLYSEEMRLSRKNWFQEFLSQHKTISAQNLLHFHQHTETENKEYGLQINRKNNLKTVSISQCVISKKDIKMTYLDLFDQK